MALSWPPGAFPDALGSMTISLHKLTAGTGYTYLTRQVAAHDRAGGPRTSLASYYSDRGETPGLWVGSGVAGIDGLAVGDEVTAEQMRLLFGFGLHPLADQREERLQGPGLTERDYREARRLGVPFKVYTAEATAFQVEIAKAIEDHNAALGHPRDYPVAAQDRARIRSKVAAEMFRAEHGRDPRDARELSGTIAKLSRPRTTAVGGYDLTFSPVKSVSTLWAIAPPQVAAQVELAHNEAVADALAFIEAHALYTREGTNGVRQVDVTGLVATAFTHRDSRAGDPDLHTHVAVANKVQTLQGKWLAIDGRILFKAKVTASETYNTALEKHLRTRLGLTFAERPGTERGKRPIREVVGVDPALNQRWSTRRAQHRGPPRRARDRVPGRPRPPADGRGGDPAGPAGHLGDPRRQARTPHPDRATSRVAGAGRGRPRRACRGVGHGRTALSAGRAAPGGTVDAAWVRDTAARVRDEIQARRSTWQVWHVRAEAHRQVRAANLPAEHVDTVVDLVTDHTLRDASVRLTPAGDGIDEPAELRRADGSSMFEVAGSTIYTSSRSWPPKPASSRPLASPTGTAPTLTRSRWPCSSRPPTASPSTRDRPPWSSRWPPPAPASSSPSPPPEPERPPPCVP